MIRHGTVAPVATKKNAVTTKNRINQKPIIFYSMCFGKASSVGKTTVNTSAESSGKDTRELEARYQQYIRVRFNLAIIKARRKLRSGESNEEHSAS